MNESINKELIFNYFSGRATAFEKELIDQWSQHEEAKEQLFIWLLEWENQNLQYQANIEKAVSRHFLQVEESAFTNPSDHDQLVFDDGRRSWGKKMFWQIAAAAALIILTGGWFFQDRIGYEIYATGYGQTQRLQLADGSKVVLNSNSSLRVPRFNFGQRAREVYLTGEANFNVSHTVDHKIFIVHTSKNLDIEVLGTDFNVYSRTRGSRVVLHRGKVRLHYRDGGAAKNITMKPGDLVTLDTEGRASVKKTDNPQNYSAWKTHRFIFENESLREICNLFEDNFGVKVLIPDSTLAAQTISGSFTVLNAEELLEILTDDSGLSYEKSDDGKVITLDY